MKMIKRLSAITAAMLLLLILLPLLILPALAADEVELPEGYVVPEDYYYRNTKNEPDPYMETSVKDADGYYVGLEYIHSESLRGDNYEHIMYYPHDMYGTESHPKNEELGSESVVYNTIQNMEWKRNTDNGSFTLSGTTAVTNFTYSFSLTFSNIRFGILVDEDGKAMDFNAAQVYADIKGTETTSSKFFTRNREIDEKDVTNSLVVQKDCTTYLDFFVKGTDTETTNQSGGLTIRFRVYGIKFKEDSKYFSITQKAAGDSGETSTAIPAVAGGILFGSSVAAAAALSSSKSKKKAKNSNYQMLVSKDFGDSIRKGANPVAVRARMAEITADGILQYRPDLNVNITVAGRRIAVHSVRLVGGFVEALVSVPPEYDGDEATVSFIYRTNNGSFQNNIVFKIVGDPFINFVDENTDGSLKPQGNRALISAILGDGFEYSSVFLLRDATDEPVRFKIDCESRDFSARVVPTDRRFMYRAYCKNLSAAPDRNEIFTKIRKTNIYVTTVFKDGSEATCTISTSLFPEGLSVRAEHVDNEGIPVKCYDLDKWNHERFAGEKFWLTLAVKNPKGAEIFHLPDSKVKLTFAKNLEGDTRLKDPVSDKIAGKYGFKIEPEGRGEFRFIPQDWLFQPKKDTVYGAVLAAVCSYQGTRYERNIPLRLIGQLDDPMGGWQKEYDGLKKRIEKFSLPEEKDKWLARYEQCSVNPPCSVEELRLVSKEILYRYMDYWEKQNEKDKAYALKMDRMLSVAEWTKFVGDCAFSYLVKLYAGPLADAVITPCKDIFLYSVGEYLASCGRGESFDVRNLEIYKSLNTAGDLVSSIWMAQGVKSNLTDFKKIFYYIAGYFVLAIFRNYFKIMGEQNKSDWWGAITAAFRDLTISTFRIAAGELFRKWIEKSQLFKKMFGEKTAELITKELKGQIKTNVDFNSKGVTFSENISPETAVALAVERFLVRLVGKGAAAVYDKLAPKFANSSFGLNEQNQPVYCFPFYESDSGITVYIEINLTQIITCMASGPFAFGVLLFQTFFNRLIGWNEPVTIQSDPPVERDRKREQRTQAELKANYDKMFNNPSS